MSFSQWVANKFDFIHLLEDYKRPLVLCIDELDKLLQPELPDKGSSQQQYLWSFLTIHFLKENRLLIFSTHGTSTVQLLGSHNTVSGHGRLIKVRRLPRMERKEDMQFLNEYGFTLTEAALCGCSAHRFSLRVQPSTGNEGRQTLLYSGTFCPYLS